MAFSFLAIINMLLHMIFQDLLIILPVWIVFFRASFRTMLKSFANSSLIEPFILTFAVEFLRVIAINFTFLSGRLLALSFTTVET